MRLSRFRQQLPAPAELNGPGALDHWGVGAYEARQSLELLLQSLRATTLGHHPGGRAFLAPCVSSWGTLLRGHPRVRWMSISRGPRFSASHAGMPADLRCAKGPSQPILHLDAITGGDGIGGRRIVDDSRVVHSDPARTSEKTLLAKCVHVNPSKRVEIPQTTLISLGILHRFPFMSAKAIKMETARFAACFGVRSFHDAALLVMCRRRRWSLLLQTSACSESHCEPSRSSLWRHCSAS